MTTLPPDPLPSSTPPPSAIRETTTALISAFNRMDIPSIIALRTPNCKRQILPHSLGFAPQDNATYARSLERLIPIFRNFSLEADEYVEDPAARKVTLCLRARADTAAGEYVNEYVWMLTFDDAGTRIADVKEFVDTGVYRDFWPLLKAAMEDERAAREAAGAAATATAAASAHDDIPSP